MWRLMALCSPGPASGAVIASRATSGDDKEGPVGHRPVSTGGFRTYRVLSAHIHYGGGNRPNYYVAGVGVTPVGPMRRNNTMHIGWAPGDENNCLVHSLAQILLTRSQSGVATDYSGVCRSARRFLVFSLAVDASGYLSAAVCWRAVLLALGCNPSQFSVLCFCAERRIVRQFGAGAVPCMLWFEDGHFSPIFGDAHLIIGGRGADFVKIGDCVGGGNSAQRGTCPCGARFRQPRDQVRSNFCATCRARRIRRSCGSMYRPRQDGPSFSDRCDVCVESAKSESAAATLRIDQGKQGQVESSAYPTGSRRIKCPCGSRFRSSRGVASSPYCSFCRTKGAICTCGKKFAPMADGAISMTRCAGCAISDPPHPNLNGGDRPRRIDGAEFESTTADPQINQNSPDGRDVGTYPTNPTRATCPCGLRF